MPGGGTRTFLEPDHYEASLGQAQIQAIILPRDKFRARITWAELHHLQVLRCAEDAPRVAYVQFAPGLAFVTFSADSGPLPVWHGTEMQAGDIMFHGRGERLHQSTPGPFVWNVIAMDPAQLEYYGRALSGTPFSLPAEGRTLQPSRRIAAGLRRLHARICRLGETKPKIVSHFEVARAMEQGLIQMLVTCLTTASARADDHAKRRHARIMVRFEEVLAEHLSRPLRMPELCALVAVSDRTLRLCCAEFLDMSPTQYLLLRRLTGVRRALRDARPHMVKVAEVARRFRLRGAGALRRDIPGDIWRGPIDHSPTYSRNATPSSVNFLNFCIVGEETHGLTLRLQRQCGQRPNLATLPADTRRERPKEKDPQDQFVGSPRAVNSACAEPLKQGKMSRPQGGPRFDNEIRLTHAHFRHGRWHVHPDERRNGQGVGRGIN